MNLEYSNNVNRETIHKLLQLDSLVYSIEQQGDMDSVWARYLRNTETFTVVLHHTEPIGYLCAFPIRDELYSEIKNGKFLLDKDIDPEQVMSYQEDATFNLYIISIVIHPDYQGSAALKYILSGFADHIETLERSGIKFNGILAQGISDKGNKLLSRLGFDEVTSSSKGTLIMETTVSHVVDRIRKIIRID